MTVDRKQRIEFGDFQTPDDLAKEVCHRLKGLGCRPDVVIEPTCGVGAFVLAAADVFPGAKSVLGFEVNDSYLDALRTRVAARQDEGRIKLERADFFAMNWKARIESAPGNVLVLGNLPWVTNATQGAIGGSNLPAKSNFLGFTGFEAISGKANFDISEWMLLDVLRWLSSRGGEIAMLVKTAVARKVLAHAERQRKPVTEALLFEIDAKKSFGASVDACLLFMRIDPKHVASYDYLVFDHLTARTCQRKVGHRQGLIVGDLEKFDTFAHLLGESPQKWRSGVKHDASSVMEFTRTGSKFENGQGELVELEDRYLFPLLKGSDIGSGKEWRRKFVLITQRAVGQETASIERSAPMTWRYLVEHAQQLDARGSSIYAKNPRFSVFGVGEYAFRPWRIAICGLYKSLRFRLVGPMEEKPVMFDDTVYYLSFETRDEAEQALQGLRSEPAQGLLSSLIFWDEKRPIKTSILNVLDWSKGGARVAAQHRLF